MTRSAPARLLLLGGIWGTSFYLIRIALEGLSPTQIVAGRVLAGAAMLWVLLLVRRQPVVRDPVIWAHAAFIGVIANVLPFFLFSWGEERVSSGVAGVYNATTPLMTLLFALVALPEERPTLTRVAGLLLGMAGVLVLISPWNGVGRNALSGQLACLAASASYGVGFNYTRRYLSTRGVPPLSLSVCQLTSSSVVVLLLAPFVARQPMHLKANVVAAVLVLGAVGSGIAFVLYHGLVRDVGATSASMVTFIIPVVAVVLGVVALDEEAGWNLVLGGLVVICGVALAEGRLRGRSAEAEPPTSDLAPCPEPDSA